jgi:hypothetical protein
MLVHVWETSCRGDGCRLMRCNCSTVFPEVQHGGHSDDRCDIDIGKVNQLGVRTSTAAASTPYITAQSRYLYAMYAQTPAYAPQPQAYATAPIYSAYAMPEPPIYSTSTNGMPVNVRGGAILTEARGIFIRNLSYRCTQDDLNGLLLQTVGFPIHIQLQRDSRTGVFKGAATAKFASKELAQHAAITLNGREHMGMTLDVRMDTDTTVVGRAEPMVVNGSYGVSIQSLSSFSQLTTSSTKSHLPGNWYHGISEVIAGVQRLSGYRHAKWLIMDYIRILVTQLSIIGQRSCYSSYPWLDVVDAIIVAMASLYVENLTRWGYY